jgi:hypothetical protein
MRGGSAKGLFFHERDLPQDPAERDRLFVRLLGAPDPKQIDGLGGGSPFASRIGIVSPSMRENTEVDFVFGLLNPARDRVVFEGTCGNLLSAVGPFAIDEKLVPVHEPVTRVRIYDVNTKEQILAEVPMSNGRAKTEGTYSILGVPGTGARIDLHFSQTSGTITGKLLPTGLVRQKLETSRGTFEVSLVDAIAPTVFVHAKEVSLIGDETPEAVEKNVNLLLLLELIRQRGGVEMGIPPSHHLPKVVFVSRPKSGETLTARLMSMGKIVKDYTISCGICTAIAARLPGSIPHEVSQNGGDFVRIGHPTGVFEIGAKVEGTRVEDVTVPRTARRLMKGNAYDL